MTDTIDILHPMVDIAFKKFKESISENAPWDEVERLFENRYTCKIVYSDSYGIGGKLIFPNEKYLSMFILQNSTEN